ncbi:hypothetical protein EMPS_05928 [Entomortierella parvispora]|uniref:Uncharacterized protein n=1 Tax=Entomortierella parvispora TaxID=205924 RepID=A0A9P3LX83_9FUNG|nr:hypothetical protein EMPS_05928 [Entomortierella parvispora]
MAMAMAQSDLDRSFSASSTSSSSATATTTTTINNTAATTIGQRNSSNGTLHNKSRNNSGGASTGRNSDNDSTNNNYTDSDLMNSLANFGLYNDYNDSTIYDSDIGGSSNNFDDELGNESDNSSGRLFSSNQTGPKDGPILTRLLSNGDLFPMILGELDTWSLLQLASINARFRREILVPATPNLCCLNQFFRTRTVICPMAHFESLKDFMAKYRSFKPLHIHFTYSEKSSLMTLTPEISAPIYNSKTDPLFSHLSTSPVSTSHLMGVNQSISINLTSTTNSLFQVHHPITVPQRRQLLMQGNMHQQQQQHSQSLQGQQIVHPQEQLLAQNHQLQQLRHEKQQAELHKQQQYHQEKQQKQQKQQPHLLRPRPDQKQTLSHTQHENDQPENAGGSSNSSSSSINTGMKTMSTTAALKQHASFPLAHASTRTDGSDSESARKEIEINGEEDKNSIEGTSRATKETIPKSGLTAAITKASAASTDSIRSTLTSISVISVPSGPTTPTTEPAALTTVTTVWDPATPVEVPLYGSRSMDYYGPGNTVKSGDSIYSLQSRSPPTYTVDRPSNPHLPRHQHQRSISDAIPIWSTSYSPFSSSSPASSGHASSAADQHHGFELTYWQKFALNELFMRLLPFLKTLTIGRTDRPTLRRERDSSSWVSHSRTRTVSPLTSSSSSATTAAAIPSASAVESNIGSSGSYPNNTHNNNGAQGESDLYMGVCFFLARCFNVMHDMPDTALESVVWMDVTANDVVLLNKMIELRDIMVDERYWKRGYWGVVYDSRSNSPQSNSNAHSKSASSSSESLQEEEEEEDDENEARGPDGRDWDGFYFLMYQDQTTTDPPVDPTKPVQVYKSLRAKVVEATTVPKAHRLQRRKGKGKDSVRDARLSP